MDYTVTLSATETQLLENLIGKQINSVLAYSGYSVRLLCENEILDFTPEEFSTPEMDNRLADVTRPIITNNRSQVNAKINDWEEIAADLGTVESVMILRATVIFTARIPVQKPIIIAGVELPGAYEWSFALVHPDNSSLNQIRQFPEKALVTLDIGLLFTTTKTSPLYIYTDGCGYCVRGKINGDFPKDMKDKVKLLPLSSD